MYNVEQKKNDKAWGDKEVGKCLSYLLEKLDYVLFHFKEECFNMFQNNLKNSKSVFFKQMNFSLFREMKSIKTKCIKLLRTWLREFCTVNLAPITSLCSEVFNLEVGCYAILNDNRCFLAPVTINTNFHKFCLIDNFKDLSKYLCIFYNIIAITCNCSFSDWVINNLSLQISITFWVKSCFLSTEFVYWK